MTIIKILKPAKEQPLQQNETSCKYYSSCMLDCRGCELANKEVKTRTYYESTKYLRGNK